ncbi:MAG: hypothetical protein AB1598_15115, partial [Thermodesulfobacteriota bacterium]
YDFSTGALLSATGFNNETTTYSYNDPLDRLTTETRPTGFGKTDYIYSAPGVFPATVQIRTQLQGSDFITSTSYFDGTLNLIRQERTDAGTGGVVITETRYDALGRAVRVSNPRRTIAAETDGWTRTTYDAIGRVTSISNCADESQTQDCTGTVTSEYAGAQVTITDQQGKQRRSISDALGRLRKVFEPDAAGALTLLTQYQYDARSNLRTAIQGTQARSFEYDSLGRLTSATNPENGTVVYSYDQASNLISRTDARNITTNYDYDELNRVVSKSYSDDTPAVTYLYDKQSGIPINVGSALGRLVGVMSGNGADAVGTFYGYDLGGRIVRGSQLLDGRLYQSTVDYNEASLPIEEAFLPTSAVVQTSYNAVGQIDSVTRNGAILSTNTSYTATGALNSQRLGNNLLHSITYNHRLQPKTIALGS